MSATRRGFLRGAMAGGAAVAGLGLAAESARASDPAPLRGAHGDGQLLARLIAYEQVAEFAYSYLARSAPLSAQAKKLFARLLGQEREHARLLSAALREPGSSLFAPQRGIVAAADRELARLGVNGRLENAHQQDAAVHLLISIEGAGQNLYYGAIERLSSPALLALAAEILACEGQHWTGLSNILHPAQPGTTVPHAFVPLVGQFSG
jgi:rubrerythrin